MLRGYEDIRKWMTYGGIWDEEKNGRKDNDSHPLGFYDYVWPAHPPDVAF